MKKGSEEALPNQQYTFSLRTINSQTQMNAPLTHNFAPLYCRNTSRFIRTVPRYHGELDFPFQNDADMNLCSIKVITDEEYLPNSIYVAKPNSRFCHICKESFEDYLKHVNHRYHVQKLQEQNRKYPIDSLKSMCLRRRDKGQRKTSWNVLNDSLIQKQQLNSFRTRSDVITLESLPCKKRKLTRQDGQIESITIQSSTAEIQSIQAPLPRYYLQKPVKQLNPVSNMQIIDN